MPSSNEKFGLCLSGGGFRAALFHIGTLIALAERRMLHRVEVLSTVSGGSVIGAYYYLKVKQLLEGKRPGCPIPEPVHYLDIVQEIERDFLNAVQKNIRMRLFLNPCKTARMLLDEDYSRSDRLAELFNQYFFDSVSRIKDIRLKAIHITPHNAAKYLDEKGKFSVTEYNKQEQYKIPVLTINATCLNTGHPFHFTGSWVGEPQRTEQYAMEQNSNFVLPLLRFDGEQGEHSKVLDSIMLADAVAASAAVPGIFPPLPIHGLYNNSDGDEIVIELSDGGVFDNQGMDALLVAKCSHVFVSDACGQLEDERLLSTGSLSVGLRANDIMMERIRGKGYFDLDLLGVHCQGADAHATLPTKSCFIERSTFTHLREETVNTKQMPALPGPVNATGGAVYRLSAIRTDFDAFSDMEAYSLMYQGYGLAHRKLDAIEQRESIQPSRPWHFLNIREVITSDLADLYRHLQVGKHKFYKSFRLDPCVSWTWLLAVLAPILLIAGWWLCSNWNTPVFRASVPIVAENRNCCCGAVLPNLQPHQASPSCASEFAGITMRHYSIELPLATWGEMFLYLLVGLLTLLPISAKGRALFKTLAWLRILKTNPVADVVSKLSIVPLTILSTLASVSVWIYLALFNRIFLNAGKVPRK